MDRFIRQFRNWDEFFAATAQLPESASSNRPSKGKVFERLTQLYLQAESEYQTKLRKVWLLDELPTDVRERLRLPVEDEGIDLVAETRAGDFWAIQSKFRTETNRALTAVSCLRSRT